MRERGCSREVDASHGQRKRAPRAAAMDRQFTGVKVDRLRQIRQRELGARGHGLETITTAHK